MIERVTTQQIADAMHITKRSAERRAKKDNWPYDEETTKGGRRRLYTLAMLPTDIQAAVIQRHGIADDANAPAPQQDAPFDYDREQLWANYDNRPESMKAKAKTRLTAIKTALQLIANGTPRTRAFSTAARSAGFSSASLYRWYQDINRYDEADWLAALMPKYIGRTKKANCSTEAWEFFKADYLRPEQPGYAACYHRLERTAAEHGWTIPSLKTLQRRMEKEVPLSVRVLKREGENALMRLYPAQQRSVATLHALQWINADGYLHNVFVQWPDGTIARPKTWFFQDIHSRMFLSWRTDQSEHTDVIRLAFGDLVERFGIPEHVTIDNTRAAANKWMTGGVPNRYRFKVKEDDPLGLFPVLGVQVHWTSVIAGKGHGQAKPIERAFGVGGLGEYIDKHPAFAGAYTGPNPTAKPDNYGSKAIPLETFLKVLEQEIHAWNAKEGRRTEIANGRSFQQVFETSYTQATIRKATEEQRRLWLLTAEAVRVANDASVVLDAGQASGVGKNRYHAEALYAFTGKKVIVRFDPDQLHNAVHFYTLDGRYIAEGHCINATGFGDTQAAREHSRARKQFIKASKEAAKAEKKMDAIEVASQLPGTDAPVTPAPGVVQMVQQPTFTARQPERQPLDEKHKALQQQIAHELQQPVVKRIDQFESPKDRYARWARIEQQIANGEGVPAELREQLSRYQRSDEYRSMKSFFEEFGLSIGEAQ